MTVKFVVKPRSFIKVSEKNRGEELKVSRASGERLINMVLRA